MHASLFDLQRDLLAMLDPRPAGGAIFFDPTDAFIDWLIAYADGRLIIELGPGEGWLLHRLASAGKAMLMGIEIMPRVGRYENLVRTFDVPRCIMADSAVGHPLLDESGALVIVARPDHSGWVEAMLEAREGSAEVLYVGLPKNLSRDLPNTLFETIQIPGPAGREGEIVVRIEP